MARASRLLVVCMCLLGVPASAAAAAPTAYLRVNQVGFAPGEPIRALLLSTTPWHGERFSAVRRGGDVVSHGSVGRRLGHWSHRFPYVYALDLSGLPQPGTYVIKV